MWNQIFVNILNFAGTNPLTGVADTSTNILKILAWVSFVLLFAFTCPIFLVYSFIVGSRDDVHTKPVELLKAIAIWGVCIPVLTFIYVIVDSLITAGSGIGIMDAGALTNASLFSWIIALIGIVGIDAYPMICVLRGYGFLEEKGSDK